MTLSNSDTFQSKQVLTLSNSDTYKAEQYLTFRFWHFPILKFSDSDTFQFWNFPMLLKTGQKYILTLSNSDTFQSPSKSEGIGEWSWVVKSIFSGDTEAG